MNSRTIVPVLLLASVALVAASGARAADETALAKTRKCGSCHAMTDKMVGPPFQSIAAKYAGQKDAELAATEARLAKKIREGGSGVWGVVPMPANPEVTTEEAKRLVQWVLQQK